MDFNTSLHSNKHAYFNASLIVFEELRVSQYYMLSQNPEYDPEQLEEMARRTTRHVGTECILDPVDF